MLRLEPMQLNHTKGKDTTHKVLRETNKNKREAYQGHEDMLRVEKTCNKIIFCMIQTADQLLCKQEDHIQL